MDPGLRREDSKSGALGGLKHDFLTCFFAGMMKQICFGTDERVSKTHSWLENSGEAS
jgi:hypothetical protein